MTAPGRCSSTISKSCANRISDKSGPWQKVGFGAVASAKTLPRRADPAKKADFCFLITAIGDRLAGMLITRFLAISCILLMAQLSRDAQPMADRFVWVFGWGLGKDSDLNAIGRVLE